MTWRARCSIAIKIGARWLTRKRIEDRAAPIVVATAVLAVVRVLVLVPVHAGAVAVVPTLALVSVLGTDDYTH